MFKNTKKISTKLLVSFMIVAVVSAFSGIMGTYMLQDTNKKYSAALEDYGFAQGVIGKLGMAINENRAYTRDIVFLSDKSDLDKAYNLIQQNADKIDKLVEEVRPSNKSETAQALFAEIEKLLGDYRVARDEVVKLGMANVDIELAYNIWDTKASPIINEVADKIDELLKLNTDGGTEISDRLSETGFKSNIFMISAVVAGFIISILLSLSISKSISHPIMLVENAAKKLSKGHLDIKMHVDSKDEIGRMTDSFGEASNMFSEIIADVSRGLSEIAEGNFNIDARADFKGDFLKIKDSITMIIESLSNTLGQINQAADQVSSGAEQVASGAQSLSQGTTEQASSIEELSATIIEISQQVRRSAENAENASRLTQESSNEVNRGNEQMKLLTRAMSEISSTSSEIGKIIKAIEDIAFQTNILALNAAVEAARAGTAGKGFAVVADEVRNLAGKSAEAAKNTTALIESAITAVENGNKIADDTAKSLEKIVYSTEQSASLINDIAKATVAQSESINQVTEGVDQISSVIQNNSATAEESAAASQELSAQARMLKQLVNGFKLKGTTVQFSLEEAKEINVSLERQEKY